MRKLILAGTLIAACTLIAKAQNCPTASFTITDSICAGNAITLTNTSNGGTNPLNYYWDFCPGDISKIPVYDTIGDFGNFTNLTYGLDLVFDNGNWYAFALNGGFASVTRFDFGNSLQNYPTPVDLGNISGVMQQETDIQVIKENNLWYAFVCKFNGDIIRIDFGASITNPAPVATPLSITPGFIANPFNMKLIKDHGSFKILTANAGGYTISVIDIGTTITNSSPSISNLSTSFTAISGLTVVRDCDNWYGFTVSSGSTDVFIIDFGDTLTSNPLSITNLNIQSTINPSFEIEVINEGGKWYGLTLGYTLNRINFGNSLTTPSPPVDNLPINFNTNERNFCIKKSGSNWTGIITYAAGDANPDLRRFVFPDNCAANIPESTDTDPLGVTFSASGFQQVTLQVTDADGNFSFYSDSVYLESAPQTNFYHSPACIGIAVDFADSSVISGGTITSWNWDFGDSNTSSAQHPSHMYMTPGDFLVTLTATSSSGCSNTYSDTVKVRALPVASFSFLDNVCAESQVTFTDGSTSAQDPIAFWNWDFGDSTNALLSNPTHSYLTGGTYLVSLTVTTDKGCSSVYEDSIHIRPRPLPDFTVANTCIGKSVTFTNLSTISGGGSLTYDWDFGDLLSSTATNPTHQYPAIVSIYNVVLIANSTNGCSDTLSKEVRIGNQPIPAFNISPSTICKGNSVTFTDLSIVPGAGIGDTIISWFWDFGDSGSSNIPNPVHAYSDTGTYVVTLVVSSPTSCDSLVSQVVTVIDAPSAAFNYTNVCFGLTNTFTDFSSAPAGSVITTRSWDFGDSTTATGITVTHTYAMAGTYDVVLTVTDTFGCTDFVMHQVTIFPLPVASFTNTVACTGAQTIFSNTSSIGNGDTITNYFWDFGDGNFSTAINPANSYNAYGSKTIQLIAVSSNGCSDTTFQLVYVNQSPNPGFTYTQTCKGEATQFNYIANPFPSTIATYSWSFGDLGTSNLDNPLHTYSTATTYNATVLVTDNTGCVASITLPVTVNPIPDANFVYTSGCSGIPATFTDSSSVATGIISSYLWNFGGGNTSTASSPQFVFDSAGVYQVILKVTSDAGCVDSTTDLITIVDVPEAGFTMSGNVGSPPYSVTFTNTSINSTSYLWDFGDGNTSGLANPTHLYTDTGIFTISLYAYNQEGCSDTAYNSVIILIPHTDLAVLQVTTTRQNNLLTISADLFNFGNVVINNFEIVASLAGGSIIHENYNKPLFPGKLKYDFNASLETNQYTNPAYLCVEVRSPNGIQDEVPGNNKKCAGTGGGFDFNNIYNDPFTEQAIFNFNIPSAETITIEIRDVTGKKVSEDLKFSGIKGYNTYVFDGRTLSKGIYYCYMKYREESQVKSLLKF